MRLAPGVAGDLARVGVPPLAADDVEGDGIGAAILPVVGGQRLERFDDAVLERRSARSPLATPQVVSSSKNVSLAAIS